MTNLTAKAARCAVVLGCAVTLGLSALAAAAPAQASSTTFEIVNNAVPLSANPPYECLGIAGGSTTLGTDAVIWNCNGHPDQVWSVRSTDTVNGIKFEQFENNDHLCLGVSGGSTTVGANLVAWTCLGTDHADQWWAPYETECGYQVVYFKNLKDNFVISTQGGDLAQNTHVVQWNFQDTCNNQWWYAHDIT
jgi:ricin-type beta-trefoil lectin protein